MLNPIITPPRVPLVDPNTGLISRAWYLFFLSLNNVANDVVNDPIVSPSAESLIASYDALLQTLTQEVQTQPTQEGALDQIAELQKQIEGLEKQIECPCTELTAELQKKIQALEVTPLPQQGTVTDVTATAPVVSSGGTAPNISMPAASTSVNGYLTSTDWNTFNGKAPATSGTSILYGNGTGGFSNVTIGSGVTFAAGTLSATGSGGTVTSVTGTAPVVSSGGTTPAISLAASYGDTQNPYASKTANTFLAAPNGAAGVPTFRAIVAADVPALPYNPTAAPATYTANFSVAATDVWIINNKSGSSCTVTLPTASANTGRVLYFQNYQNQTLVSASSNVVPLAGGSAGTAILQAMAGATTTLVSNGTNWIIMQYSSNNALQLE